MDLMGIKAHYAGRLAEYGHTPQGVDWKDEAAQMDRLNALCLLFGRDEGYTLNDWGCGYGRLARMTRHSRYFGYDIVDHADEFERGEFILSDRPTRIATYTVASGLFNVMGDGRERAEWALYVKRCVLQMDEMSRAGFAFNALHVRADRKRDELFYASPGWFLSFINHDRISILQHYSPWDFTILVHKEQPKC